MMIRMGRKREGEYPKTTVSLRLSVDVLDAIDNIVVEAWKRGVKVSRSAVVDIVLRDFVENGGVARFLALWDSLHGGMPREEKLPQEMAQEEAE